MGNLKAPFSKSLKLFTKKKTIGNIFFLESDSGAQLWRLSLLRLVVGKTSAPNIHTKAVTCEFLL